MFKNLVKSIFNMEEKKVSLQVGTIRALDDGTRQVVVSVGSRAAQEELGKLSNQIGMANSKIEQLKKIGLANTAKDVIVSCVRDINGLAEVLASVLYNSRAALNREIALTQAKVMIENSFAVAKESDEERTPEGFNWWPVMRNNLLLKYRNYICLNENGLRLKPEAKEAIEATFVVWAEGEQAEKFIHLCELVKELNESLPGNDFDFWHGWQYYFYLEEGKGLQMTDNWRLEMIANKTQPK